MEIRDVREQHKRKYFYTILFLNNYFLQIPKQNTEHTDIITYQIKEDTDTENIKWVNENILSVKHNLMLPITLEMWDNNNNPIFYSPIILEDIDNLSVGDITRVSKYELEMNFTNIVKPTGDQEYKLALRSLPMFNLKENNYPEQKIGLAIIFRRYNLDSLFDLIVQFDESYWHTLEQNFDLQYLTKESCYQDCFFTNKYTDNLQDVIKLIDRTKYEIKFSWDNVKDKYHNPIYL